METITLTRPGPAVSSDTPTTRGLLSVGFFFSENYLGVTRIVPPPPIEIEGNEATIRPPSMEVGRPYRFIFKGAELFAVRRSFGDDVDIYTVQQPKGDDGDGN